MITQMQRSPDAAFLLDVEGNIIYSNKAAQLMINLNVHEMSICSLFSFVETCPYGASTSSSCWDDISNGMTNSDPQHHDVFILDNDGTKLDFHLSIVKFPTDLLGEANRDVFACAYVMPSHDHERDIQRQKSGGMQSIAEEGTEQDNEEQLLRHMKDVVQASLDPMFAINENGNITVANDPAVQLFGYTRSELIGKDVTSICPMAREVQNILDFMHAPSINQQQIATAVNKAGTELSIELGLSLNQNFANSTKHVYFAHMKDLTELEKHKSEIEHKDNLCQAMINASFDPMFGIDQRGTIMVVNAAACQAFGYDRTEFIGNNIKMICNDRDAISHDKHLRRYVRSGEKRVIGKKRPLVAKRKDGTEFHIELGVSEVNLSNGEKMFCGYVRDRTQERLDKQNLRRKEAVIQDKFFQVKPEDARGAERKRHTVASCQQWISVAFR